MDRSSRIIKYPFLIGLKTYKVAVSPVLNSLLGGACRFEPTCSVYSKDAMSKHGVIKGSLLSLFRVLRCNPFSKGGYDPA